MYTMFENRPSGSLMTNVKEVGVNLSLLAKLHINVFHFITIIFVHSFVVCSRVILG